MKNSTVNVTNPSRPASSTEPAASGDSPDEPDSAAQPSRLIEYRDLTRSFLTEVVDQFIHRGCINASAALTYTTLIAVVPFVAIIYRVLSLMPVFDDTGDKITAFIFDNFVAGPSEIVLEKVREFSTNANELTLVGVVALFVTTILLLMTVERTFNEIWQTNSKRSGFSRFLTYWGVVSFGVPLIGAAVVASSYGFGLSFLTEYDTIGVIDWIGAYFPPIAMAITFTLLFYAVPSAHVSFRHALIGGVVTMAMFELAKGIFGLVVPLFQQQFIYGTLAALPLFLMGLYILWTLVLVGAVIVRTLSIPRRIDTDDAPLLMKCTRILKLLYEAHRNGTTVAESVIAARVPMNEDERAAIVTVLTEKQVLRVLDDSRWMLARSLQEVSLWDLYVALPDVDGSEDERADPGASVFDEFRSFGRERMKMNMEQLLA